MFNNKEVQVLISGAEIPVDIEDLKIHTNYTGNISSHFPGYSSIKIFVFLSHCCLVEHFQQLVNPFFFQVDMIQTIRQ